MILCKRLSWYFRSPNEDTAKHYQMSFDTAVIPDDNIILKTLMQRARADGIMIPPKDIITFPCPVGNFEYNPTFWEKTRLKMKYKYRKLLRQTKSFFNVK